MKYEEAVRKLEELVRKIESNELDIDKLADHLKEAQSLLKLCKERLTKVEEDIKTLLE